MAKRILLPLLLILAMFLLDTAVFPFLLTGNYIPLFSLLTVACIGLLLGKTRGVLYGLIAGLLLDITVSDPLGMQALLYALVGLSTGIFSRKSQNHRAINIFLPLLCYMLYEIVLLLYAGAAGLEISGEHAKQILLRVCMETAITQLLLQWYKRLLKPLLY